MKTPSASLAAVSGILVLINLVGNCIICAVILRNGFMRTPINFLLLNLAVADIYIGIFALPVRVFGGVYKHPEGELGNKLCKIITGDHVLYCGVTASAFNLCAIAYERYLAVIHPFTARKMVTSRKVFLLIMADWLLAVAIVSFFWFVSVFDHKKQYCVIEPRFRSVNSIYTMLYGCSVAGVPFVIMLLLYGRVILEMVKKQRQVFSTEGMARNRFKKRITLMLLVVTAIFLSTWVAAAIIVLSVGGYYPGSSSAMASTVLVCINSSVNCFVYNLFSTQFRRGLRNLLCCYDANDVAGRLQHAERNAAGEEYSNGKTATFDTKF